MKLSQLFENTWTEKPQTKEDYQRAIDKAKEIIEKAEAYAKERIDGIESGARGIRGEDGKITPGTATQKKRWTKDATAMKDGIVYRMNLVIKLHEKIIPEFNEIKRKFNDAAAKKDVQTLKTCHWDFKKLIEEHNLLKELRDLKKATTYKMEEGYPRKIIDAINYMVDVRDYAPKEIIAAGRTDAENETAAKRSAAARRAWGAF